MMAIRADSFSSTSEVTAYTRHLLDGQSSFNSTTRPTVTEMEKFIDRASGILNVAISNEGFTPSDVYGNSTAKLACDDWVTQKAVMYTELTQRGTGYSVEEGSRTAAKAETGREIEGRRYGTRRAGARPEAGEEAGYLYRSGVSLQSGGPEAYREGHAVSSGD